ncbi:MAG TPA: thymidine phosphorylase, partial [Candidatus Eremiobacteraceae bacterium]|nr:thymidine phosphorylase [Candidatus Eremiobacteraceae bacterium]
MTRSDAAFMALVERKRRGLEHTREELEALVDGYSTGRIVDKDFTLWLRAVMESGLSDDETVWLTQAMASSGVILSWNDVAGIVVDKHSTGGVGDDVSLIAVPLAAACGVKVAKLSARSLGHTGGTIDKLECVPNLRTDLSVAAFKRQVAEVGCAIAQATDEIAPADKKIYALRQQTQTVESIGLITASVLSKKIAGGAPHLVIDVKCGRSAFMQTPEQAHSLARM